MQVMSKEEERLYKQLLLLAEGDSLLVEKAIRAAQREPGTSTVTFDAILKSLAQLKTVATNEYVPPTAAVM